VSRFPTARCGILLLCGFAFAIVGCVPIAYVYPSLGFIPPGQLNAPTDEVRVFRVDVSKQYEGQGEGPSLCRCTLREVPCTAEGRVPGQTQVAVTMWQHDPYSFTPWSGTTPDVEMRLYRPNWQTVRVRSWQWPDRIEWKKAASLEEREEAVDHLLFAAGLPLNKVKADGTARKEGGGLMFDWNGTPAALAPGSTSAVHKESLLFAAVEYEGLAGLTVLTTGDESQKTRLLLKAQRLRQLANE
jgi:hypothetical protein